MRNCCILVLLSAALATVLLPSSRTQLASAQEIVKQSQLVAALDGTMNESPRLKPAPQFATHELCGIGLGGYCPGGYRACLRAGRPKAECEARNARCEACNQEMLECRQKVGHQPGYTCPQCRKALDRCRAGLSAPTK